jgi:hypothetical protein
MPGWLWVVIAVVLALLIYLSLRRRGGAGRHREAPAIEYLPDEVRSGEGHVDPEGHVELEGHVDREGHVELEGHVERQTRPGEDPQALRQEIPEDPPVGAPSVAEVRPQVARTAEEPPAQEPPAQEPPAQERPPAAPDDADPKGGAKPGDPESDYGAGSAVPGPTGIGPQGWTVKGNADSMLFYTTDAPSYLRSKADVWFESEEAATTAGFTRWNAHHR